MSCNRAGKGSNAWDFVCREQGIEPLRIQIMDGNRVADLPERSGYLIRNRMVEASGIWMREDYGDVHEFSQRYFPAVALKNV